MDIAVPRDVEPAIAGLAGVEVYDLDALQVRLNGNLELRRREVPAVEAIVEEEVHRFEEWRHATALRPLLTEIHARGEAIRRRELERMLRRLGDAPPELRAQLEAFSHALVNKLLHQPTHRLRQTANPDEVRTYTSVTRELFGLEGPPSSMDGNAA